MQRLFALAIVILSGTFYTESYAQTFDTTGASTAGSNAPAQSPVMNTDQFKSTVDTLTKQAKSGLTQQVDQQLSTKAAGPGSSSAPSTPAPTPPPASAPSQTDEDITNTAAPGSTPAATIKKPATNAPAATPSSQAYTGFGTGQPAQKSDATSGSQDKGSSNWNVGY